MKSSSTTTWGLGLEHETAPAVLRPDGRWALLDVTEFNASEQSPSSTPGVVVLSRGQKAIVSVLPRAQQPVTVEGKSILDTVVYLKFLDPKTGVLSRAITTTRNGLKPRSGRFEDDHRQLCRVHAELAAHWAHRLSVTTFAMLVQAHPSYTDIIITAPGAMDATRPAAVERMLFRSTCHLSREKPSDLPSHEFELDSGFVEVKSAKFKNATVGSVVAEVTAAERRVLLRGKQIAAAAGLKGNVGFVPYAQNVVTEGVATSMSYAGSFHVWITLPHRSGADLDHAAFVRDHARLLRVLQWLEPLLVACMPGDKRAPGASRTFPRGSARARLNLLSGYGVASLAQEPVKRNVLCYESLAAANSDGELSVVATDEILMPIVGGGSVNVLMCQRQGRYNRVSNYDVEDNYADVDDSRVDWTMGTGFTMHQNGTDMRYDMCWLCDDAVGGISREPGSYAFVKAPGSTVQIVFRRLGVFVALETCIRLVGLECRLFDHMPDGAAAVTGVVVTAAAAAAALSTPPAPAPGDAHWMKAMVDGAGHGSRTPVSSTYWRKLCAAFALPDRPRAPRSAFAALNAILGLAFKTHGKTPLAKKFGLTAAPAWPDVNLRSHVEAVSRLCDARPSLAASVGAARTARFTDAAIVEHLGERWLPDRFALRGSM